VEVVVEPTDRKSVRRTATSDDLKNEKTPLNSARSMKPTEMKNAKPIEVKTLVAESYWAKLPQGPLFLIYRYSQRGLSVLMRVCNSWSKQTFRFDSHLSYFVFERYISEKIVLENFLDANRVAYSKKRIPNVSFTPRLSQAELDANVVIGSEWRLTAPCKVPVKEFQKRGILVSSTLSSKQEKAALQNLVISFEFPNSFRFFTFTVFIQGVPCALGEMWTSQLLTQIEQHGTNHTVALDPIIVKALFLVELLYDIYFGPKLPVSKT